MSLLLAYWDYLCKNFLDFCEFLEQKALVYAYYLIHYSVICFSTCSLEQLNKFGSLRYGNGSM